MPPVSMKMAKLQKATLDPSKISGRCGRLKCCLRYEYDTYEEHRRELPPVGATVVTKQGTGRIIGQELLARKLMVAYEGRQVITDEKDILTVVSTKSAKPAQPAGKSEEATESTDSPRRDSRPEGEHRKEDRPRGDSPQRGGRGPRSGPPRSEGSGDRRDKPKPDRPA
jgi:hypothetical protein